MNRPLRLKKPNPKYVVKGSIGSSYIDEITKTISKLEQEVAKHSAGRSDTDLEVECNMDRSNVRKSKG